MMHGNNQQFIAFQIFFRFGFTTERLQTALIESDYRTKLFIAAVTSVFSQSLLVSLHGLEDSGRSKTGSEFPRTVRLCDRLTQRGPNQVWAQTKASGRHPLSQVPLISTPHISPHRDQSTDSTLKGVLVGLMLTLSRLWFHTIWSVIYCSVTKVHSLQADAAVPNPNK